MALVALFLVACGATPVEAHTLALGYAKGDQYRYALHMTLDMSVDVGSVSEKVKIDITGNETESVKSVDSSGVADITVSLSGVTVKTSVNGVTSSTTTTTPNSDMKVAPDGRVVSFNGLSFSGGSPFGAAGGGGPMQAVLSGSPVRPGDTWSKSYDQANPFGSGSVHITANSKYLRDEKVNGIQTAVVHTTITTPMDISIDFAKIAQMAAATKPLKGFGIKGMTFKGTTVSDVTTWLDTQARRMVKTTFTSKIDAKFSFTLAPKSTYPGPAGPFNITGIEMMEIAPA
jgi:hypothetical protein